ncbi:MAG: aldo/keto reductase [Ktedonobacteraceae bacterium]
MHIAAINAAPYNGGVLAKGPNIYSRYMYSDASPSVLTRARQMEALCERYSIPLAAAALQFSLRDPRITSTIVGVSHAERITETIAFATYRYFDLSLQWHFYLLCNRAYVFGTKRIFLFMS